MKIIQMGDMGKRFLRIAMMIFFSILPSLFSTELVQIENIGKQKEPCDFGINVKGQGDLLNINF